MILRPRVRLPVGCPASPVNTGERGSSPLCECASLARRCLWFFYDSHAARGVTSGSGMSVTPTTAALGLLLGVLCVAAFGRLWMAMLAAVAATLCLNFFFLPPVGTFTVA